MSHVDESQMTGYIFDGTPLGPFSKRVHRVSGTETLTPEKIFRPWPIFGDRCGFLLASFSNFVRPILGNVRRYALFYGNCNGKACDDFNTIIIGRQLALQRHI